MRASLPSGRRAKASPGATPVSGVLPRWAQFFSSLLSEQPDSPFVAATSLALEGRTLFESGGRLYALCGLEPSSPAAASVLSGGRGDVTVFRVNAIAGALGLGSCT
jgi:hypothetical protein